MKKFFDYIPTLGFVVVASFFVIGGLNPKHDGGAFDSETFGKIPVLEGGRFKPLDSLARTKLLLFSGKSRTYDESGHKISASDWISRVLLDPMSVEDFKVFRIDHEDLKTMVGGKALDAKLYSYRELKPYFSKIETQARLVDAEPSLRNAFEKAIVALHSKLVEYQNLSISVRPEETTHSVETLFRKVSERLEIESLNQISGSTRSQFVSVGPLDPIILEWLNRADHFSSNQRSLRLIPAADTDGIWQTHQAALNRASESGRLPESLLSWARLADSFSAQDWGRCNEMVREIYETSSDSHEDLDSRKLFWEYLFNDIDPFLLCMELYILVMLATFVSWISLNKITYRTAWILLFVTVILHSIGMGLRMWIMGRPPVTNLYSSAIYVGWGTACLGLIMEWIHRNGLGNLVASLTGLMSLIVAHHLMANGDTMQMMQAVLDSNFWLTTHVLTVTMGYSASFVAGFLAVAYVVLGVFTKRLDHPTEQSIQRMVYGIVCFSLLFSFVGTFLGGIWADQSWGRFWGWDPKENGALMIVVWSALIIHVWRARIVKTRGMMLLAIAGNMITAWSWFGTNLLGQGLHSYGFMEGAMFWLFAFWISQIVVILIGKYVPERKWRSFR